jgi:hypothetical protein
MRLWGTSSWDPSAIAGRQADSAFVLRAWENTWRASFQEKEEPIPKKILFVLSGPDSVSHCPAHTLAYKKKADRHQYPEPK